MKYIRIIIIFLLILSSCNNKDKIKGKYIIPRDKLVEVLVEIHIADGVAYTARSLQHSAVFDSLSYRKYIFEKYNITRMEFDSTISAYAHQPNKFDELYEEVINELIRREGEFTREIKELEEDPLKNN
jgi:hypothetical protein